MDGYLLPRGGSGLLAQALNALDRLEAASSWTGGMSGGQWIGLILVVMILGAGIVIGLVLLLRRQRQVRQQRQAFLAHAEGLGLSEREQRVLSVMAKAGRIRNPEAVFTSTVAFETGEAAMMRTRRVAEMSEDRRQTIAGIVDSLREKLGLGRPEQASGGGTGASGPNPDLAAGAEQLPVAAADRPPPGHLVGF